MSTRGQSRQHDRAAVRLAPALLVLLLLGACAPSDDLWLGVRNGELDLRDGLPGNRWTVRLNGDWRYYPHALLAPGDAALAAPPSAFAHVPGTWDDRAGDSGLPAGQGFATYALRVRLPAATGLLAVRVITASSAYRLYASGRLVASAGEVGESAAAYRPAYRPQVAAFSPPPDGDLELVLQVANFSHAKGGPWEPLWLGTPDAIRAGRERRIAVALLLVGTFTVMGLYHLILWLTRRADRSTLYFATVCLVMVLRDLCVDEVYISDLVPRIPWALQVRIEYASLLLLVASMAPFLRQIFPREEPRWLVRAFTGAALGGTAVVAFTRPVFFTRGLPFVQAFCLVAATLGTMYVVLAALRRREGALLFLLGLVAILFTGAHDVLISVYRELRASVFFGSTLYLQPFGFFVFALSQSSLIAIRSSRTIHELESTRDALREAHDDLDAHARKLEQRVAERTAELASANQKLARLAEIDGLTRVGNRRFFEEELRRAWLDHLRRAAPLSLVLVDVDQFKAFNDHYGHLAGDAALQRVAATLAGSANRPGDSTARYGGEEFVALLPNTPAAGARRVGELARERIAGAAIPHELSAAAPHLTVSVGVASLVPRDDLERSALVERADRALYRAKQEGRNRVAGLEDAASDDDGPRNAEPA